MCDQMGFPYKNIRPCMTRDFEVTFGNETETRLAAEIFKNYKCSHDNVGIFEEVEIRTKSLFVTLTYPNEIRKGYFMSNGSNRIDLFENCVFVAIKNGEHCSKGYFIHEEEISKFEDQEFIWSLKDRLFQ